MGRPKIQIPCDELRELYQNQKLSPLTIAQRYACHRQTIVNHLRYCGMPVRSKGAGTALAKIISPRTDFNGDATERAYLIGLRIGDLTVDHINPEGQTIRVECASTRPEQIELLRSLFGNYGRLVENGPYAKGRVSIQCLLNMSFAFLLDKPKSIPQWVLESDETFLAFVAGYSDAEAHFGVSGGKARFALATADAMILQQIYARFINMDIVCPPPQLWLRSGHSSKTGGTTRRDIWRLGVYRSTSLLRLIESLDTYLRHAKRRRDMEIVRAHLLSKENKIA